MTPNCFAKPARLLPPEARDRLVKAAQKAPSLPAGASEHRTECVDKAIAWSREHFPQFFRSNT